MLRLLRVREENRLSALRQSRNELDRVRGVVGQLEHYAQEYREQLMRRAETGASPTELMATLDFEQRLSQTADLQKRVVGQLEGDFSLLLAQVAELRMRAQGIQKMLDKRQAEQMQRRNRAEAREVEENIAARQMIGGMKDAPKRS